MQKKSYPHPVEYIASGKIELPLRKVIAPCVLDSGATSQFY